MPTVTGELHRSQPRSSPVNFTEYPRFFMPANTPQSSTAIGHFTVRLSSRNWAGVQLQADFGGLGDIPIPADYDGDGLTDFAVYQPGGGPNRDDPSDTRGFWRWCSSSYFSTQDATDCTQAGAIHAIDFGRRDSLPLPGLNFDGDSSTGEFEVYRKDPITKRGHFSWRNVNSGGTYRDVTLGSWSAVPLPGLYDSDNKTDLVVYNRHSAAFEILSSAQNYSTDLVRQFDSKFIPTPRGAGGVLLLYRMTSSIGGQSRAALALWAPSDGTWSTLWDPLNSSAVKSCSWGQEMDQPLAGADFNVDGRSDMAVLRNNSGGSAVFGTRRRGHQVVAALKAQ